MTTTADRIDHQLAVDTIRTLSIDGVQQANSGHPGAPMGAAPMAYVLWTRFLEHAPAHPHWFDRDRFVLSAGHASMLLYSLLHLTGYDLPLEELKRFRQFGSITPGHPEYGMTAGVEATTGPLGQGFTNAVGMAIAERRLAAEFNRPGHAIIDHWTYGICSDGDLQEGIRSAEAASLAGHLRLGKLVFLYDDNGIQLDGPTKMAWSEDVLARFDAYGWHTQRVADGNDLAAIEAALTAARADDRPSLIAVKTVIGFGSPNRAGSQKAHGAPLGPEEVRLTKEAYGWDPGPDVLHPRCGAGALPQRRGRRGAARRRVGGPPPRLRRRVPRGGRGAPAAHQGQAARRLGRRTSPPGRTARTAWPPARPRRPRSRRWAPRCRSCSVAPRTCPRATSRTSRVPVSSPPRTRAATSASVSASTPWAASPTASPTTAGFIPYVATFMTFSDYMRGSVRLAALSGLHVVYVWTHDSIGVGEDGPTHQPVEHYAALRAIPNLTFIRPGDPNEAVAAWHLAITRTGRTRRARASRARSCRSCDGTAADAVEGRGAGRLHPRGGRRPRRATRPTRT